MTATQKIQLLICELERLRDIVSEDDVDSIDLVLEQVETKTPESQGSGAPMTRTNSES